MTRRSYRHSRNRGQPAHPPAAAPKPSTAPVATGRAASPAAAATASQRASARFQPGQNAHQPGSAVVNQPGTPDSARVPGEMNVASVRRRPSGAPAANRPASRASRHVTRSACPARVPRRPGTRIRGTREEPSARPASQRNPAPNAASTTTALTASVITRANPVCTSGHTSGRNRGHTRANQPHLPRTLPAHPSHTQTAPPCGHRARRDDPGPAVSWADGCPWDIAESGSRSHGRPGTGRPERRPEG